MSGDKKETAVAFLEYMCAEDCAFRKCVKDLGTNVAVLFYLREFERWLKKSPQDTMEQNEHNRPTSPAQNGEA